MASTWTSLAVFLVELSLAYWVAAVFVQYWRLRHVPGPFLAKFTPLWRAYHHWKGVVIKDLLIKLHEEHGPLVRIAPNVVSVGEAASVKTIYGTKNKFLKVSGTITDP